MIDAVRDWVAQHAADCWPPVLEVGAYNMNGTIRDLLPESYIAMDMREGPGVDIVADVLAMEFVPDQFATIVCVETLEHVTEPWAAIDRMAGWLQPDGLLLVTVPFSWEYHPCPDDYWRMTASGLRYLFERAGLEVVECETRENTTYGVAKKCAS